MTIKKLCKDVKKLTGDKETYYRGDIDEAVKVTCAVLAFHEADSPGVGVAIVLCNSQLTKGRAAKIRKLGAGK